MPRIDLMPMLAVTQRDMHLVVSGIDGLEDGLWLRSRYFLWFVLLTEPFPLLILKPYLCMGLHVY